MNDLLNLEASNMTQMNDSPKWVTSTSHINDPPEWLTQWHTRLRRTMMKLPPGRTIQAMSHPEDIRTHNTRSYSVLKTHQQTNKPTNPQPTNKPTNPLQQNFTTNLKKIQTNKPTKRKPFHTPKGQVNINTHPKEKYLVRTKSNPKTKPYIIYILLQESILN